MTRLKLKLLKKQPEPNAATPLTLAQTKAMLGDRDPEGDDPEGSESESDIVLPKDYSKAILAPTDWTIETLVSQLKQKNIELNPYFQRREAWRPSRQARFIESLFLGLPIPEIVLVESKQAQGKFVVLDGKQRLLSIVHFAASDVFKVSPLRLEGLRFRDDLDGMSLEDMKADPALTTELARFNNRTVRTVVIKNWPDTDYIHLVFERLNTESVKLSPQELRQAMFPGGFVHFVASRSSNSPWLLKIFGSTEPDFRMRDVELLVRHIAYRHRIEEYGGNLKKFMDDTCKFMNENWARLKPSIESDADSLDAAIEATYDIFNDQAFRKWTGKDYEPAFNRAVFDAITYYFADKRIREAALRRGPGIVRAFKKLCTSREEFDKAITTTTKSTVATQTRLRLWGEVLSKEIEIHINPPQLKKLKPV